MKAEFQAKWTLHLMIIEKERGKLYVTLTRHFCYILFHNQYVLEEGIHHNIIKFNSFIINLKSKNNGGGKKKKKNCLFY